MTSKPAETVIPLIEERLRVERSVQATGRVRVAVSTTTEERVVEEVLRRRAVEIIRTPIDRVVEAPPPVREEGDSLVIPVVEEVLVVERRLVLREELRLRLPLSERRETATIALRRQTATIERLPIEFPTQQERQPMRTVTGLFDSRAEAERTVETLVQQHGIDRQGITVRAAGSENATAGTTEPRSEEHHGFLASLRDMFMPDDDRATYAEGLRRGGILVAVEAPDDRLDAVMEAFEQHGAVDLDTREAEWRAGGWSGAAATSTYGGDAVIGPSSDGTASGLAAQPVGTAAPVTVPSAVPSTGATGTAADTASASTVRGMPAGEEAIPLIEERLRVGKREASAGRVRVRTYVVETPVQEQVTLREEHVAVERRPVDRPLTEADRAAFTDRTIEATETSEEAVVGKEARVREEVVVRKEVGERTETVSDTVRRTEVEVDDDRTATRSTTPKPRDPAR